MKQQPYTERHSGALLTLGRAMNNATAIGVSSWNPEYLGRIKQALQAEIAKIDTEIRKIKAEQY